MDIFESLENLNVSEECFDEIMGLVEEILSEDTVSYAGKMISRNEHAKRNAKSQAEYDTAKNNIERLKDLRDKAEDLQGTERKNTPIDHRRSANDRGYKKHKANQEGHRPSAGEKGNRSIRGTWAKDIEDEYKYDYEKPISDMRITKAKMRNERKLYKKTKEPKVLKTQLEYPSKYGYNPDAGADYGYGD